MWVKMDVVSKHLGMSRYGIYRLIAKRLIPVGRLGGKMRFNLDDVDAAIRGTYKRLEEGRKGGVDPVSGKRWGKKPGTGLRFKPEDVARIRRRYRAPASLGLRELARAEKTTVSTLRALLSGRGAYVSLVCDEPPLQDVEMRRRRGRRKLSFDDATSVRERAAQGEGLKPIARDLGVHPATVRQIVAGDTYKDVKPPKEKTVPLPRSEKKPPVPNMMAPKDQALEPGAAERHPKPPMKQHRGPGVMPGELLSWTQRLVP